MVDNFWKRPFLVIAQVFSNTIKNNDRIIQGIPNDSQQRGDRIQVDLDADSKHMEQPDAAESDQDIVEKTEEGCCSELIFKSKYQVDEDAHKRDRKPDDCMIAHCIGHLSAHWGPARMKLWKRGFW